MTDRTFDVELSFLKEKILKMGCLVSDSIFDCIEALKNRDEKISKQIIEKDMKIDAMELEINDNCIELIARWQPVAVDLRFITTAMSIATDLERIGDLSVDIAQKNLEIIKEPLLKPLIDIPKLSEVAKSMICEVLDAFVAKDAAKARGLRKLEKESDALRDLITDELTAMMMKDGSAVPKAVPLLLIARFLERICDHAMNIAEDVVYMVEGKVIKHGQDNQNPQ